MKEELDVAWAAGILEGEGCFFIYDRNIRTGSKNIGIRCNMTDEDIILRLKDVFSFGTIHVKSPKKPQHKVGWEWRLEKHSSIEEVINKVLPYLGKRRSSKAKELLAYIDSRKKPDAG